jgi:hypothetical protein
LLSYWYGTVSGAGGRRSPSRSGDNPGGDNLAPSLFLFISLAVLLPGLSSVEGAGETVLVDPAGTGEETFTISPRDPAGQIAQKSLLEKVYDSLVDLKDDVLSLPETIMGMFWDALLSIVNFFVDIVVSISNFIQNMFQLAEEDHSPDVWKATGDLLLSVVFVLGSMLIIRLWTMALDILPVF